MPLSSHLLFHLLELSQQAVAPGLPFEQEFAVATSAANEGKAEKVESFRFSEAALSASVRREAAKLDQAGLVRMEGQRELPQSLRLIFTFQYARKARGLRNAPRSAGRYRSAAA